MPAAAQALAAWGHGKIISNRTDPKHPKGSAKFGFIRLEKEKKRKDDMAARGRIKTINDNSWHINGNSCETNSQWQFVVIDFSLKPVGTKDSDYLSQQQVLVQPHLAEGEKFPAQVLERCAQMKDLAVDD